MVGTVHRTGVELARFSPVSRGTLAFHIDTRGPVHAPSAAGALLACIPGEPQLALASAVDTLPAITTLKIVLRTDWAQ